MKHFKQTRCQQDSIQALDDLQQRTLEALNDANLKDQFEQLELVYQLISNVKHQALLQHIKAK